MTLTKCRKFEVQASTQDHKSRQLAHPTPSNHIKPSPHCSSFFGQQAVPGRAPACRPTPYTPNGRGTNHQGCLHSFVQMRLPETCQRSGNMDLIPEVHIVCLGFRVSNNLIPNPAPKARMLIAQHRDCKPGSGARTIGSKLVQAATG